jgi:hypothetical protein
VLFPNNGSMSLGLLKAVGTRAVGDAELEEPSEAKAKRRSRMSLVESSVIEKKEHTSPVSYVSCVAHTFRKPWYINAVAVVVWEVQHGTRAGAINYRLRDST